MKKKTSIDEWSSGEDKKPKGRFSWWFSSSLLGPASAASIGCCCSTAAVQQRKYQHQLPLLHHLRMAPTAYSRRCVWTISIGKASGGPLSICVSLATSCLRDAPGPHCSVLFILSVAEIPQAKNVDPIPEAPASEASPSYENNWLQLCVRCAQNRYASRHTAVDA